MNLLGSTGCLAYNCRQPCRQHLRHHSLFGISNVHPGKPAEIAQAGGLRPADHLLLVLTVRPALAAESAAVSVSHGVSERALVWVMLSDSQLRWLSQSQLQCGVAVALQSR